MKKVLILLLVISTLFLNITNCNALVKTYDRNTLDNYGVNKKWQITSSNKSSVLNSPAVDASEKIYDFSGILTEEEIEKLREEIDEFIGNTNMDMVIMTVNLPYYTDKTNEVYAVDFYDYNDFGIDFENYSGVLFLRNTYQLDPYFNIYTFGDAQLYFDYNRLENVLDSVYNDIHNENYLSGFQTFIDKMQTYYDRGIANSKKNYKIDENGYLYKVYSIPVGIIFIGASIVSLIVSLVLVMKNKMIRKATGASEYINRSSININNRQDIFLHSRTTHYTSSSSSGGGGGGSSGGSSGGGHSSGGGRHG